MILENSGFARNSQKEGRMLCHPSYLHRSSVLYTLKGFGECKWHPLAPELTRSLCAADRNVIAQECRAEFPRAQAFLVFT